MDNTDVVVLSAHRRGHLRAGKRFGNFVLTTGWPPASGEVFWTTVHAFKGLESPIVILAELDDDVHPDPVTVAYVGMSRARNHLIVLASQNLSKGVKNALLQTENFTQSE